MVSRRCTTACAGGRRRPCRRLTINASTCSSPAATRRSAGDAAVAAMLARIECGIAFNRRAQLSSSWLKPSGLSTLAGGILTGLPGCRPPTPALRFLRVLAAQALSVVGQSGLNGKKVGLVAALRSSFLDESLHAVARFVALPQFRRAAWPNQKVFSHRLD